MVRYAGPTSTLQGTFLRFSLLSYWISTLLRLHQACGFFTSLNFIYWASLNNKCLTLTKISHKIMTKIRGTLTLFYNTLLTKSRYRSIRTKTTLSSESERVEYNILKILEHTNFFSSNFWFVSTHNTSTYTQIYTCWR